MAILFGATGMVGQAIAAEAHRRGRKLAGVSRHGSDRTADLADLDALRALLEDEAPDLVINAAAVADIDICERDPAAALSVNARAVLVMAEYCHDAAIPLVQISTDHFFTGNGPQPHTELAPVALLNEYARTKYLGEGFACVAPLALVVRTNVTGLRGIASRPTFAEWAFDALERRAPITLFDDFYASTIDAPSFARALLDLVDRGATGIVNLAARTVASKWRFVHAPREDAGDHARLGRSGERQEPCRAARRKPGARRVESRAHLGLRAPRYRPGVPQSSLATGKRAMRYSTRFLIGGREIALDRPAYFIADIAANHDGDLERAKDLIWRAKEAGADAAKFQHFVADKIVSDLGFRQLGGQIAHQAKWQKSVFEVYRQYSIDRDWDGTLVDTARQAGIDWMTTPYDREATDAVADLLPAFKIGSGDITWLQSIEHIACEGQAGAAGDRRVVPDGRRAGGGRGAAPQSASVPSSVQHQLHRLAREPAPSSICACCKATQCTGRACRSACRTTRRATRRCWARSRSARASSKSISPTMRRGPAPITPSR